MPTLFQINAVANSGSTGRIAEGIAKTMISEGWECYIAYGRWANGSNAVLYRIGNRLSVYWHYLLSRFFDGQGLGSKKATKKLIEEIKHINPDIIQLHNIHGYYLNYPLLFEFLSSANIPVVWTLHDCWTFTGHCVHYSEKGCYKWKEEGCHDCPNRNDYPLSLIDRSFSNFKKKRFYFCSLKRLTIVPVSFWLGREVEKSFLSKYPIRVIQNGIDTSAFSPIESDIREKYGIGNRFLILGVSTQWNRRKGLYDFISLSKHLSKDEVIVLVGLTRSQIASLPSNMIGILRTENTLELVKLYTAADLYVNFSIEETFGLTTTESMACGTPALVYNSTACPEIVSDEVGFVVEPHNVEQAYNAIQTVKQRGKDFYRDKCISYVRNRFNRKGMLQKYRDLYNELLAR